MYESAALREVAMLTKFPGLFADDMISLGLSDLYSIFRCAPIGRESFESMNHPLIVEEGVLIIPGFGQSF